MIKKLMALFLTWIIIFSFANSKSERTDGKMSEATKRMATVESIEALSAALTAEIAAQKTAIKGAIEALPNATQAAATAALNAADVAIAAAGGIEYGVGIYNETNLIQFMDCTSSTTGNVTFVNNGDGTFTVNGYDASYNNWKSFFADADHLPYGIVPGGEYRIRFDSTNVELAMYDYTNGSVSQIFRFKGYHDEVITIPANCEGLIVRLLVAPNTNVTNETVKPEIMINAEKDQMAKLGNMTPIDLEVMNLIYYMNNHSFSVDGLTFTYKEKTGEYTVTGTSTASGYSNIYANNAEMPFGMEAGGKYLVNFESENIALTFFNWTGNAVSQIARMKSSGIITIPAGCEGMIIRFDFDNNKTISETIRPIVYKLFERSDILKYNGAVNLSSCDDAPDNNIVFSSYSGGTKSIADFPINAAGWLQTITQSSNIKLQLAYPYEQADEIKYRSRRMDGWGAWKSIGSGGGTTTIVQEVSHDTYENTYNLTVSPQITTDSNGWLQAVDTESADETGKTDMTSAIMALLNSNGYCHLGPGIFYVSGNINIPDGGMLEGCGRDTIIRLLGSVTSGYICSVKKFCTIRNIRFSGSYSDITPSSTLGGRIGIYFNRNDGAAETRYLCQISNCWIDNLDSGIFCYNTGGGTYQGLMVNDVAIYRCNAGINIDKFSEYSKYSNIVTHECYYGCINNGGNNVFVGCTFHGVIGFLIDNSGNDKNNNAHGSCIGCTFNHIDNMNHPETSGSGLGVKILSATTGFVFDGCQLWYGEIYVESSPGILFADCLMGGGTPTIQVAGSGGVAIFNGCVFGSAPSITSTGTVLMNNCYTQSGSPVTN